MRKVTWFISAAGLLLFLAVAPPAQADIIQSRTVCHTESNDAGGKSVDVCVKIGFDNTHYWTRVTFDKVTGQSLPYGIESFHSQGGVLWSRATNESNYCEGRWSACNGGGNANWLQTNLQNSQAPYTYDTDHYVNLSEHKCWLHGETYFGIFWTQSDYNNLNQEVHSWNTATVNGEGDYDARPNCVGG